MKLMESENSEVLQHCDPDFNLDCAFNMTEDECLSGKAWDKECQNVSNIFLNHTEYGRVTFTVRLSLNKHYVRAADHVQIHVEADQKYPDVPRS